MRRRILAVPLAIVLTGCSTATGGDNRTDAAAAAEGIELLRDAVMFEHEPYDTPKDMLDDVDMAVVGNVVSVSLAVEEMEPEHMGVVIVRLRTTEVWEGDPSGDVYYYFHRPNNVGVDPYREALPQGSRVVLFGDNATADPPPDGEGHDPEPMTFAQSSVDLGTVYSANPQGLFIEDAEDRLVNVWAQDIASSEWSISNVDDLRSSLGR